MKSLIVALGALFALSFAVESQAFDFCGRSAFRQGFRQGQRSSFQRQQFVAPVYRQQFVQPVYVQRVQPVYVAPVQAYQVQQSYQVQQFAVPATGCQSFFGY